MLLQNVTTAPIRPIARHAASGDDRIVLALAVPHDREEIYRIRHDIYARELWQHQTNAAGRLTDSPDDHNLYLVARCGGALAGFVSITPPMAPTLSIGKYVARSALPYAVDDGLYEIRLLTVLRPHRGQNVAIGGQPVVVLVSASSRPGSYLMPTSFDSWTLNKVVAVVPTASSRVGVGTTAAT